MPKRIVTVILCLLNFLVLSLSAQTATRGIAIWDLSVKNGETNNARLFSVEHMVKVAGIKYIVTQDLAEASSYDMIFCSSLLGTSTLTTEEKTALAVFVENGGTLLAPRVQDEDLFPLFGIAGYESDFDRFEINWNATVESEALAWIDEPEEWTVSLGRSTYDAIYKTLGYAPNSAETLATFEDGTAAVTHNTYGNGHAVTIGLSFKEVILRNQINRDYEAQRITSNGFEPTSDVFSLFVRGLYAELHPYAVWKHTSPGRSAATVMITHDIDSGTGMDTLEIFVDYEFAENIEATYNVTVRYFDDELMDPYYLNREATMEYIKSHGQAFGSHSVGHFFDFADEDIFPIGAAGDTTASYVSFHDGDVTVGGTVYAECEVSKDELEKDLEVPIRAFRAGHLAFPKFLIDVLDELGYEYNSTVSASDVLTNFPYQNKTGRSFSGQVSQVYELPVTISDVFHSDPIGPTNYLEKSDIWLAVTRKNIGNGAPTVLLIHPNRNYKLMGMKHYLDRLPNSVNIMEMSRFGDYWKAREAFDFDSELVDEELTIIIPAEENLADNISFVVKDGQDLSTIFVKDEKGNTLDFEPKNWGDKDILLAYQPLLVNTAEEIVKGASLNIYPSPTQDQLHIEFDLARAGKVQIELFDLHGNRVNELLNQRLNKGLKKKNISLSTQNISQGIYLVVLRTGNGEMMRKKIVLL
ncbi:MAG: T9SS type A sorting domain-containing protein [Saprospiraceae bacterium]